MKRITICEQQYRTANKTVCVMQFASEYERCKLSVFGGSSGGGGDDSVNIV